MRVWGLAFGVYLLLTEVEGAGLRFGIWGLRLGVWGVRCGDYPIDAVQFDFPVVMHVLALCG